MFESRLRQRTKRLGALEFFKGNRTFKLYDFITASHYSIHDAFMLLLVLCGEGMIDCCLLVYHSKHPNVPIIRRHLADGPGGVYRCPICGKKPDDTELSYDFEFCLTEEFTIEKLEKIICVLSYK